MNHESLYTILSTAIVALLLGIAKLVAMLRESRSKSVAAAAKVKIEEKSAEQDRVQAVFDRMQSILDGVLLRLASAEHENVETQKRLHECDLDRADAKTQLADCKAQLADLQKWRSLMQGGGGL